jgi:hypothetical protein
MESNFDLENKAKSMGMPGLLVTTKDRLKDERRPVSCIVNLQDDFDSKGNDLSGTHWCAVYVEGKKCCYFDPIGFPPSAEVQLYLYDLRPYPFNNQQVQDEKGGWCGTYCLFFLKFFHKNKQIESMDTRLNRFLQLFSTNPKDNETLLSNYLP